MGDVVFPVPKGYAVSPRHSLVSLWDMYELNAQRFVGAVSTLWWLRGKRANAINAAAFLEGHEDAVKALVEDLSAMDLLSSATEARRLGEKSKVMDKSTGWAVKTIDNIARRLVDDLKGHKFLALSVSEQFLYEQTEPLFGTEVANKFPGLAYEIAEIGKCLALNRSTAAAFHAIRCLEAGFAALWRCIGVTGSNQWCRAKLEQPENQSC